MTWLWIVLGIVVLLVIWFIASYNKLVHSKQLVEEAFSGMDVYLKKRYDLIPNLVETVKAYAKHESETFDSVVKARGEAISGSQGNDLAKKIEGEKNLESAISRMMLVVEQYPNLKADSQFLDLQRQLNMVETDISQSRKYYNGAVRQLNEAVRKIPTNIVAGIAGFREEPYYDVSNEAERENVKVSF